MNLSSTAARYWDELADRYQGETRISVEDFHYGPLLPGDRELGLLPKKLGGLRCLEIGCGAGQNSIYLARCGAEAHGVDISARQLAHARRLAAEVGQRIHLHEADMDELPEGLGSFNLVHSAYGVPFSRDPGGLFRRMGELLRPGGRLVVSMGHPVYAGEWMEVDEDERGIFLTDYFHPSPDLREGEEEASESCARAYPLSEVVAWIHGAGLRLDDLREPRAQPVEEWSEEEIAQRVPYYSEGWAGQAEELRRFPIVAIFSAVK